MLTSPSPLPSPDSITGRTAYYLWDPKNSGLQAKKGVVTVQSHEVRLRRAGCPVCWAGRPSSAER